MEAEARFARVVERYSQHVNPYLARLMSFAGFGMEVRGEGCTVFDHEGREYLDCLGGFGVFSLGHRHPRVVEAVRRQLDEMPLSSKTFFSEKQAELAWRLAEEAPGDLQFAFFSNSGAEAVEASIKFAKVATGRSRIVSTENGYHGKTLGALSVTGREKFRAPVGPLVPGVVFVPYGDARAACEAIDGETAAFIVEPVQGEGGVRVPPDGYLRAVREACDSVGALLIADEVQTGLGRTGWMFGCEHDGATPDLMPLAKALGGGVMPIGATLGTAKVWEGVFGQNPLLHTSTFGGNPLACAAALATLDVIRDEGLVERARDVGGYLANQLRESLAGQELVSEVRGRGLLIGVEFAMDEVGDLVVGQIVKRGMIAAYTLNNPRVVRIEPPLIFSREQADRATAIFVEAVAETAELLSAIA